MTEKTYKDAQEALHYIQKNLKAPKSNENKFGGYKYRSCEDILEAVKPLLPDSSNLVVSDDIAMVGDRFYVKAKAELLYKGHSISATAFAREQLDKKGMDAAQITGAASSYARKYALNGLFLIDDTKDADATNDHKKEVEIHGKKIKVSVSPVADGNHRSGNKEVDKLVDNALEMLNNAFDLEGLSAVYKHHFKICRDAGAHPDQLSIITDQKDVLKVRFENMELEGKFKNEMNNPLDGG